MRKSILGFLLLGCLIAAPRTPAAEERALTLQDCIALALQNNLGLQVARISLEIAHYNLSLQYGAWEPALNGSYNHNYSLSPGGLDSENRSFQGSERDTDSFTGGLGGLMPWGTTYNLGVTASDSYGTSPGGFVTNVVGGVTNVIAVRLPFQSASARVGALTLSQPLLRDAWIDRPRLNVSLAKKDLKASELDLRGNTEGTVSLVENAYYDLIAARENVKVQEKALELAEKLLAENKKRVEVGALAPLDEKQAESQAATTRADLLAARQSLSARENALKSLLTGNYSEWHGQLIVPSESLRAVPQLFNLQESWNKGLTRRTDVLQSRIDLEKQEITLRYDHNQLFPSLDVAGSVGYTGSGQEFSDAFGQVDRRSNPFWGVGVSVSIPLGNRSARQSYKISKAIRTQLVLGLKSLEQGVMVGIDDAVKLAQSSFEAVDATKQARIYAEAALDAEQKKLENGKSTSFEVLTLQSRLTDARSREIGALTIYNKALASLAAQEGTTLERNNVTLQVK